MPTAADFQSLTTLYPLLSKYVMLVNEQIGALQPRTGTGHQETLTANTYQLHFTVTNLVTTTTQLCATISPNVSAGSVPLWFLPYQRTATTTMTIPAGGAGPSVFMTSMLSGCTVKVHGTAANPTISHANAADVYTNTYNATALANAHLSDAAKHSAAEAAANTATTNAVNIMLPGVPMGASQGAFAKTDYFDRLTDQTLFSAKQRMKDEVPDGRRITAFEPDMIGQKPRIGGFVCGLRDANNDWSFYAQATVDTHVETRGRNPFKNAVTMRDTATTLGRPIQIFP